MQLELMLQIRTGVRKLVPETCFCMALELRVVVHLFKEL